MNFSIRPGLKPFGAADFLAAAAAFSLLRFQLASAAEDPGLGWHLKTGEWILQHRAVPRVDPFLFSPVPRPWISDQWLSDLGMYLIYNLGGWPALYTLLVCLFVIIYFAVVYPMLAQISGSRLTSAAASLVAFKVAELHFVLRPLVLGFLLFALVTLMLQREWRTARFAPDAVRLRKLYLIFPTIFLLWANLHPSFVLGLFVLLLSAVCGTAYGRLRAHAAPPRSFISGMWKLFAASSAVTLVNPNGFALHESILFLSRSSYFMRLNQEWLPPDFRDFPAALVGLMLLLPICAAFLRNERARRWGVFEILLALSFFYAALQSVRILPYAALALALPFAEAILGLAVSTARRAPKLFRMTRLFFAAFEQREQRARPAGGSIVICSFLLLSLPLTGGLPLYRGGYGPSPNLYPFEAVEALKTAAAGSRIVVAGSPDLGGFLTFYGWPRIQPVIDDRNTMLGEDAYRDYFSSLTDPAAFLSYLLRTGASCAILKSGDKAGERFRQSGLFKLLHRDDAYAVFGRPSHEGMQEFRESAR